MGKSKGPKQVQVYPYCTHVFKGRRKVSIAGTVERRCMPGGECAQCKAKARRLFAYGDIPGLFCCKACMIGHEIKQAGLHRINEAHYHQLWIAERTQRQDTEDRFLQSIRANLS